MKLGSRDSKSRRSAWPFLVALSATVVLLAGACGSPAASAPAGPALAAAPAKAVVPPDTTAGVQLRWLIAAMARLPLSGAQVRTHFDAAFLAQLSPAVLNQALQAMVSLRLLSIRVSELSTVVADVSVGDSGQRAQVLLTVDRRGLISWLRISPAVAGLSPATWLALMPPSGRPPPRSGCSSPTSPAARASRSTAWTPAPRRRSARRSSCTCSTRWAMPWPPARSAGTSR